jgi:hypothetical protein
MSAKTRIKGQKAGCLQKQELREHQAGCLQKTKIKGTLAKTKQNNNLRTKGWMTSKTRIKGTPG